MAPTQVDPTVPFLIKETSSRGFLSRIYKFTCVGSKHCSEYCLFRASNPKNVFSGHISKLGRVSHTSTRLMFSDRHWIFRSSEWIEIGLEHTGVYVNSRTCLVVFRDWFVLNRLGIDYERSPLVAVHGTLVQNSQVVQ